MKDEHGKICVGDTAMNAAKTKGWITNHYGAIADLRDKENCEQRDLYLHSYRKRHETVQSVYSLDYLIEQLQFLKTHHIPNTQIRLSMGEDQPLLATATTGEGETSMVVLAPHVEAQQDIKFREREQKLLGYEVMCEEQGCWRDTYNTLEEAREAASDHLYFEGHDCKLINAQGTVIGKDPEEGENQ